MANNELFYRAAREGLSDSDTIRELIMDLGTAIESYLVSVDECEGLEERRIVEEIELGLREARRLVTDIEAWRERAT